MRVFNVEFLWGSHGKYIRQAFITFKIYHIQNYYEDEMNEDEDEEFQQPDPCFLRIYRRSLASMCFISLARFEVSGRGLAIYFNGAWFRLV